MTACKRSCLGLSSIVKSCIEQERRGPEASLDGEVSMSGKASLHDQGETELELIHKQLLIMHSASKQSLIISHNAVSVNGEALSMTKGETELELIPYVEGGELLVLWQLHREGLGSAVELTTGDHLQSILKIHFWHEESMAYARPCSLPVMWMPAWASPASQLRAHPKTLQCF